MSQREINRNHPLYGMHYVQLRQAEELGASDEEIAVALDLCEERGWDACAEELTRVIGHRRWDNETLVFAPGREGSLPWERIYEIMQETMQQLC